MYDASGKLVYTEINGLMKEAMEKINRMNSNYQASTMGSVSEFDPVLFSNIAMTDYLTKSENYYSLPKGDKSSRSAGVKESCLEDETGGRRI